jgi:hypothetical protein
VDPDTRIIKNGELKASTVEAFGELGIASNGEWLFIGKAHESGSFEHSYIFYITIQFNTPSGESICVALENDGKVYGSLVSGDADDSWAQSGNDPRIAENWNLIKEAKAEFKLDVTFVGGSILEFIANALGVAVFGPVSFVLLSPIREGSPPGRGDWKCGWRNSPEGLKYICDK